MKISATIDSNEYDFEIIPPNEGEVFWMGKQIGGALNLNYIKFKLENGVIVDLDIDKDIDTEYGIVLERLLNEIREYNESHQMGFGKFCCTCSCQL